MALIEEMQRQGNWLFRWRGWLPLVLVPFGMIAIADTTRLGEWLDDRDPYWMAICMGVSYLGFIIRCLIIGYVPNDTSGRNVKEQRAGSVNRVGLYSLVRHPLYFGNFLVALGVVLAIKSAWFLLLFLLAYALYYERIMFAEEAYLRGKFGTEYEEWAAKTPAFIPALRKMAKPNLTFSWKMVLRREYPAFLLVPLAFLLENYFEEHIIEHEPTDHTLAVLFLITALAALCLRTLKKKTRLLQVANR